MINTDITYKYIDSPLLRGEICRSVLSSLPNWFGIPESNEMYIRDAHLLAMFAAFDGETPVGMMCLSVHNECTCEIHVMGINPEYHRRGIGRRFVDEAKRFTAEKGAQILMVKTLDASFPDEYYARTRAFYRAVGFMPLECIKEVWGERCPCLLLVMFVSARL